MKVKESKQSFSNNLLFTDQTQINELGFQETDEEEAKKLLECNRSLLEEKVISTAA